MREGLLGRMRIWPKALWLYVQMGRADLPVVAAAGGAGHPGRHPLQHGALFHGAGPLNQRLGGHRKEQARHEGDEDGVLCRSCISFIGWSLLANVAQMLLMQLWRGDRAGGRAVHAGGHLRVPMNGACAAFFLTVSSESGMSDARREMRERHAADGHGRRTPSTGRAWADEPTGMRRRTGNEAVR